MALELPGLAVTIAPETPLQDDVRELIAELNAALLRLTPREHCHHMSVEQMAGPETTVFIARDGTARAVGCGALKLHSPVLGEVKRMYTRPEIRSQRVGSALLDAIEALARDKRVAALMLETGEDPGFEGAYRLYERRGFTRRGPFLDYPDSGWSRYYEKSLA